MVQGDWARPETSRVEHHRHQNPSPPVIDATLGYFGFTTLIFVSAAYPFLLPWVYMIFFAVFMPIRYYDFIARGRPRGCNKLFLLDFCYWVNAAAAIYFLGSINTNWDAADLVRLDGERFSKRKFLKALVKRVVLMDKVGVALYALCDGPVAMALLAWANAWAFHSQEHVISVLIHLLPGLAFFSWMHLPRVEWASLKACSALLATPETALQFGACATLSSAPAERSHKEDGVMWLIGMPMLFYLTWQISYLLVVEVVLKDYAERNDLYTSFKCLRRRERRKGDASIWNRIVFTGSRWRQLLAFAGVQSLFTLGSLLIFVPSYSYWGIGLAWQVVKFAIPLHFGAQYTYSRMIDQRVKARLAAMSIFSFTSHSGSEKDDGVVGEDGEVASSCTKKD